jgi:hypothetical protein
MAKNSIQELKHELEYRLQLIRDIQVEEEGRKRLGVVEEVKMIRYLGIVLFGDLFGDGYSAATNDEVEFHVAQYFTWSNARLIMVTIAYFHDPYWPPRDWTLEFPDVQ